MPPRIATVNPSSENDMTSIGAPAKAETAVIPPVKPPTTFRIEPTTGWQSLDLGSLWAHRELLFFLIWREIKVRYKQTALGAAWALVQPLMTMLIFTLVFGRLAKIPSDGIPYPVFAFSALVPFTFFANGLTLSSNSLVNSANLITKIYFPRLALPISAVLSGLLDLSIGFVFLLLMMAFYKVPLTWRIVTVPAFVLLAIAAALGVGLWSSAINVKYRDVKHTIPFLTQVWLFATPIAYPSTMLHEPWRTISGLNPMTGVVEGFRWSLLGSKAPTAVLVMLSCATALLLLATGAFYFRRVERGFADLV
jgi:lipopolysaccharide transport system permease protein